MFQLLQIVAVALVSVAMALSLAHALELPGKLRLSKQAYVAMQPIYYPGFTIGGAVGELGGILAVLALLIFTHARAPFWLTLGALVLLILMHAAYWVLTHPVNKFWLEGERLSAASSKFFGSAKGAPIPDWESLRDRWEYSHVVRACLSGAAYILLLIAITM